VEEMIKKIAAYEAVEENMIMMSSGSSPILQAAAICYCKAGDSVISADPIYAYLL
jgi:histidinol-phosphate aminotransferase